MFWKSFKQNPTQKFLQKPHQIWKTPNFFKNPKNLDLYEWNAWKRVKTRSYQRWEDQSRPKIHWVRGLERKESVWGGEGPETIERDRRKCEKILRWAIWRNTKLNRLRGVEKLSSTKSRQIWICQGAVENLSTTKSPRWIEKLSRSYWPDRNFLDGSRICRKAIKTNSR